MDKLKEKLNQYGNIDVIKEGSVFILLMTGNNVGKNVFKILDAVTDHTDLPFIEVIKNEEHYVLIVLKY